MFEHVMVALIGNALLGLVVGVWLVLREPAGPADAVPRVLPERPEGLAYWDPLPYARASVRLDETGAWSERHWLNVPGPVYCTETLTGGSGPGVAPESVLPDEAGADFVFRQPHTPAEVEALLEAGALEPMDGYCWNGDEHWTPELVREWWAGRGRVREWIAGQNGEADEYAAYLEDGLEDDLRGYLFWLIEDREPSAGEELPVLGDGDSPRPRGAGGGCRVPDGVSGP
ncbi:hypothetical protein ACGFX4_22140 [Kitasatospora sp. NPDC048365]|uniref:hypothetical protein n=1 Tax=Kitasatospora sp. NPDC048365 TaxID=3364050 RepID=UPI003715C073